jgi:small subunit ribosomal protein S4e
MSLHMKRLTTPKSWSMEKKTAYWAPKPSPGPHPVEMGVPLVVVMRDMIACCDTAREAKRIIGAREVLIDGKIATDPKRPIGIMDVLTIPKTKENYRMMVDRRGKLRLTRIGDDEAKWKLGRIERKTSVKNGKFQITLHDGRNLLLDKSQYKTGDVLKIEVPSQKVVGKYPLEKGYMALLTAGSHVGEVRKVKGYIVSHNPKANMVEFEDGGSTVKDNVFIVGKDSPDVKLPEVSVL